MALPSPELEAQWHRYFADNLQGTDREVDVATKAAMAALVRGNSAQAVVSAGLAAIARLRGDVRPTSTDQIGSAGKTLVPATSHSEPEEWHGVPDGQATDRQPGAEASSWPHASLAQTASAPQLGEPVTATTAPTGEGSVTWVTVRGTARAVQQRPPIGSDSKDNLLFRLERYDVSGNRLPPLAVEMHSYHRIHGQISDGDEVEVNGRWQDGAIHTDAIVNLSTGSHVAGRSGWKDAPIAQKVIGVTAFTILGIAFSVASFGVIPLIAGITYLVIRARSRS